jgi:hypothetical protein
MTRGLVPISAATLRGTASARFGSNRRGIHSHSWQSRKKVRVAMRLCALVRGATGSPARSPSASRRWTQSPTVILSTAATQAAQVVLVHCPGSVISGCSAASQRPDLAKMVRMTLRTFGVSVEVACQRSIHSAHTGSAPSMSRAWW